MPGVRIQHAAERNCTYTLVDSARPYRVPYMCLPCGRTHTFKTYHFRLDEAGAAIVSVEIADRLKRLPLQGGFAITNEVEKPPPQRLVPGALIERVPIVSSPQLKEPV